MDGIIDFLRETEAHPAILLLGGLGAVYLLYSILSYLVLSYKRHVFKQAKGCKPARKFPHKDPIFGTDLILTGLNRIKAGTYLEAGRNRYNEVAPGCSTYSYIMEGSSAIATQEPENIKALLSSQFHDFSLPPRRKSALAGLFGSGIFTSDGKAWEHSRALLRPNFTRSQVGDLDSYEDHINKMIDRIPFDGSVVDLQPLFFMLTIDSATELLFNQSTDTLNTKLSNADSARFSTFFDYCQARAGLETRLGKMTTLFPDAKYKEGLKFIHSFVDEIVDKALEYRRSMGDKEKLEEEGQANRYVFLNQITLATQDRIQIRNELLNILLAGRDTTASLLSHLWFTIARRPDIFRKLKSEIGQLGAERPTFEEIKDLKYLRYCINEALRLFPVVPANARSAVKDTVSHRSLSCGVRGRRKWKGKKGHRLTEFLTDLAPRRRTRWQIPGFCEEGNTVHLPSLCHAPTDRSLGSGCPGVQA